MKNFLDDFFFLNQGISERFYFEMKMIVMDQVLRLKKFEGFYYLRQIK